MKKLLLTIGFISLLLSCSNDDSTKTPLVLTHGPSQPGTFSFNFYQNSELELVANEGTYQKWANRKEGNKLVFEYEFTADDEPMIADDEYSETIRFEVEKNTEQFTLKEANLTTSKATLTKYCFCYFPIQPEKDVQPTGEITGTKISENQWEISVAVLFYGHEQRTFTAMFNLKESSN